MPKHKKHVGTHISKNGVTFRVWAPFADSVSLQGTFKKGDPTPLELEGDGYWSVKVKEARPGQEYKYLITNGDKTIVKNDPRSLQLTATHGTSIIVDPNFDWGDDDSFEIPPIEEQVIYEMHVGSFRRKDASTEGTFRDAITKLDHLADLGINMIELMPIGNMYQDHGWGYAPEYIYSVESAYGGRNGLLEFVKSAHSKGIGVILDVVYNHFYIEQDMALYRFDGWYENDGGGIYFYNDWRGETPWGLRPDFGRYEVRQFFLDNVRYWLNECRLDGIRVDSTLFTRNVYGRYHDPDTDLSEAWMFMQELNELSKKIKPKSHITAEDVAENEYITRDATDGGAGFDSQWQVTMPYALRQALSAPNDESIDLSVLLGELARTYNNDCFQRVIFSDSHDSAANGAARINEQIKPGEPHSRIALAKHLIASGIIFTTPGVPMLLQGQEFAQEGDFNDWRELSWGNVEKFSGIVQAHKHLIELRNNVHGHTAGLKAGNINVSHIDNHNKVIVYHRWDKGGVGDDVMVFVNFGVGKHDGYVFGFPRNGTWKVRFNSMWSGYHGEFDDSNVHEVVVENGTGSINLPPNCIAILSQDN